MAKNTLTWDELSTTPPAPKWDSLSTSPKPAPVNSSSYFPVSGSGGFFTPNMQRPEVMRGAGEAAIPVIRYGAPVVSALAGPAGWLGGAVAGVLGGFTGETIAQAAEKSTGKRDEIDWDRVGAETIRSGTPIGKAGGLLKTIGANVFSAAGSEAAAGYVESGEVSPIDMALAAGSVGGLQGVGGVAGKVGELGSRASFIERRRLAPPMLSELLPGVAESEARLYARGNKIVTKAAENLDVGMAQLIAKEFPQVAGVPQVAAELAQSVKTLDPLRREAAAARDAAIAANEAVEAFRRTGQGDAREIVSAAKERALDALKAKNAYAFAVRNALGSSEPVLSDIAKGQRMTRSAEMVQAADAVNSERIGKLYGDAGIGQNDTVVTKQDVEGFLRAAARPDRGLEGMGARARVRSLLDDYYQVRRVKQPDGTFKNVTFLTLEDFNGLRSRIANDLQGDSQFADKANRIAAEAYQSVSKAADKYMRRTMPDRFSAWKKATKEAADNFAIRDTDAIVALRDGDSDRVLSSILDEGPSGPSYKAIMRYADFLGREGGTSPEVAMAARDGFLKDFFGTLRDGVLDKAMNRASGSNLPLDPKKLASTMAELYSKFPEGDRAVEALGLGTRQQINALARITTGRNEAGFTIDEVSKFLSDSNELGLNVATGRLEYARELRKQAIKGRLPTVGAQSKELKARQRKAQLSDEEARNALVAAENDPLVVFLNDTSMKLSKDPAQNANFIKKLLTLDADTAAGFRSALIRSGREAQASLISQAAATDVMRSILRETPDRVMQIDPKASHDLFRAPAQQQKRDALKAVMGTTAYNNLMNKWAGNIEEINAALYRASQKTSDFGREFERGARLGRQVGQREGGGPFIWIRSSVGEIADMARAGQYTALYKLLIDPKTSPGFGKAGYDLEKWLAAQPTNAIALRLWQQEDGQNR